MFILLCGWLVVIMRPKSLNAPINHPSINQE
jgi:hypothetical protein